MLFLNFFFLLADACALCFEQGVPGVLLSISRQYAALELERDQLRRERDAAAAEAARLAEEAAKVEEACGKQVDEALAQGQGDRLELKSCSKELEKLKKSAAQREKELQAAAAARDEELEGRLRSLVETLSG